MLEHCGIIFSWGTKFGKGGPILAAKIGPGTILAADQFFRYNATLSGTCLYGTRRSRTLGLSKSHGEYTSL